MSNPSNLYAEKIFAEHPLGLWSLDEKIDYLSLISEGNRDMSFWGTAPGFTVDFDVQDLEPTDTVGVPFLDSVTNRVAAIPDSSLEETVSMMPFAGPIPITSFNQSMQTFTVTFYIKALHSYSSAVKVGYATKTLTDVQPSFYTFETFQAPIPGEWSMYSATFPVPSDPTVATVLPIISFSYINQVVAGNNPLGDYDYSYLFNGITVGQWSEEFNAVSLGIPVTDINSFLADTSPLPNQFSLLGDQYVDGAQYGLGSNDARYVINNQKLLAKNTSIPMVYGASNLTKIVPHTANIIFTNPPTGVVPTPQMAYPSLMLPGFGMLHPIGRYNTYTFEAWLRIDNRSEVSRRIIGPMLSDYGLYVDGPFLKLKIGDSVGSYFVGEWYRPMLIDIRLGIDYANLLVNGEQVLSINFKTNDLSLIDNTYSDYWGVYAYEDVPIIEVDCPAIYSYIVPSVVAKRRFGYAQAVESPDGVNKSFGASTAFVDYSVADYTNNYQYPDMGKWNQGISENVDLDLNTLASPKHELPEFVFLNSNYTSWFEEQSGNTSEFFTFASKPGFLRFNDINIASSPTKGVYLIFNTATLPTSEQLLFRLADRLSGDSISVYLLGENINYKIKARGIETMFYQQSGVVPNANVFAGISFDNFSDVFGGDVQTFFARASQITMLVAGDPSFNSVFTGKIVKVGLATERNLKKISDYFEVLDAQIQEADAGDPPTVIWEGTLDGGDPTSFKYDELSNHIATYTLQALIRYNVYSIDIASESYWQDYVPLSYFAQYVTNIFGEPYTDLDFIQFNIDYPVIPIFAGNNYDTSNSLVKTYVTFQLLAEGATKQLNTFTNFRSASATNVLEVTGSEWMNTAYEVVDGTIIYPPHDVPVSRLALVTHVEILVGESTNNQISIKKLQYASQAFNSDTANPIGTKFNIPVFPYQKFGALFDYKAPNPYRIYKGSTPHLYLTRKTGLQKVGSYDSLINRGFLIRINDKQADEYRVIAAQMFAYYDGDKLPIGTTKVFELQSDYQYIKFYMQPIDSLRRRARIYAQNAKTGANQDGIAFYINGKLVKDPVINVNEWTAIGVRFAEPMVFDNSVGAMRVTGPLVVNNISYYESSSLQEVERQSYRLWDAISAESRNWDYWKDLINRFGQSYLWRDVLVIFSTKYSGISPTDIYNAYVGASKIIGDDDTQFYLGGVSYKTVNATSWSTITSKPL